MKLVYTLADKLSHADVVKLVYTLALGANAARRAGSSPVIRTNTIILIMKYLLLVAIVLFLAVAVWCIHTVGRRNELSISLHIAQSRLTIWVFRIIGIIATILATIVLFGFTLPGHSAPVITYVALGIIIFEIAITVNIPHIENTWRGTIHNMSAWGLCFSIPFATLALLLSKLNQSAFWYTIATLITEAILLIMALGWPNLRKWFLQFQSAYLVVFFAQLAVITFIP